MAANMAANRLNMYISAHRSATKRNEESISIYNFKVRKSNALYWRQFGSVTFQDGANMAAKIDICISQPIGKLNRQIKNRFR